MSKNVNWEDPTEEDLRWAIEWERKRDLELAGYDYEELRKRFEEMDREEKNADDSEALEQAESVEEELPDYNTWTNGELREELSTRELSTEGNKAALVARLEEDDQTEVSG